MTSATVCNICSNVGCETRSRCDICNDECEFAAMIAIHAAKYEQVAEHVTGKGGHGLWLQRAPRNSKAFGSSMSQTILAFTMTIVNVAVIDCEFCKVDCTRNG